jgi:hypothetical protein
MLDAETESRKIYEEELDDCAVHKEGKMWQAWERR